MVSQETGNGQVGHEYKLPGGNKEPGQGDHWHRLVLGSVFTVDVFVPVVEQLWACREILVEANIAVDVSQVNEIRVLDRLGIGQPRIDGFPAVDIDGRIRDEAPLKVP